MWKLRQSLLLVALAMVLAPVLGDEAVGGGGTQHRSEVRNALHTIHSHIRIVNDKLERHEAREHQHGEALRKTMEAAARRQHASLDGLGKLTQAVKALAEQMDNLHKDMNRNTDALSRRVDGLAARQAREEVQELAECRKELTAMHKELGGKASASQVEAEALATALATALGDRLGEGGAGAAEKTASSAEAAAQTAAAMALADAEQRARAATAATESLLLAYSKRLDSYRPPAVENDWHSLFLGALEAQGHELRSIAARSTETTELLRKLSEDQKETGGEALNATLAAVGEVQERVATHAEAAAQRVERALEMARSQGERESAEVLRALGEHTQRMDAEALHAREAYDQIQSQVLGLRSAEKVLIQTADNVLDTKRGVEYGVRQILQEAGEAMQAQARLINSTLRQRFDGLSDTILEHQTGALTNLSTKIEAEISQVWRQIGIMYQQLSASASALDRLQEQTETYVNGSAAAMDSMESKVGAIRERMNEVDDNLNYLLGRLSLFSSEFGQVRIGLAEALDDIRKTFEEAQTAIVHAKARKAAEDSKAPTFAKPSYPQDE